MQPKEKPKTPSPYKTLALAEDAVRNHEDNTTHPSEENVVETREFSIAHKL